MNAIEHLHASSFFRDFPEADLEKIAGLCREETFQPRDSILQEGDEAHRLYMLIEGAVAIQVQLKKYQDVIISTIDKKGELFGWSAVVEPKRYTATVKSLEPSTVLSIHGAGLEQLFAGSPALGLAFMKKIASLIDSRLVSTRKRLISTIT